MAEIFKDALFRQCEAVYDWMENIADKDGLFLGRTTQSLAELGIANSRYGAIFKTLRGLGCVTQIKRGGGREAISEWQLHHPPDIGDYLESKNDTANKDVSRIRSLENLVRDHAHKIDELQKHQLEMYKLLKQVYEAQQGEKITDGDVG